MIQLRTLGQIDLRDAHGHQVSSVLQNSRRLALLIYLAVARAGAFHRRDNLLALFWPELNDERARAALRKAVYHLRRSLGDNVLQSRGDDEIGLAADAITCDALEVRAAARDQDWVRITEHYAGPFLDGFFLQDAPEFEDWVARERQQLHTIGFEAAWSLASRAETDEDAYGAAHWARRAAALVPDDEGALRRLMVLLDRLGDRAGAVAAYESFARRVQRDYDTAPAAETRTLAERIRSDVTANADAPDPSVVALPVAAVSAVEPPGVPVRRRLVLALGMFAVLTTAAVSGVQFVPRQRGAPSGRVIAVMPFTYRGSADLSYLGDGIVSLLSTNLDHFGQFRAADAAAVLASDAGPASPADAAAHALRLGAGLYVRGEIVEINGRLRVHAALYDAARPNNPIAQASAEDEVGKLFALIDAITVQLAAGERRSPSERLTRLALLTTHSVPALRSYLLGEQQFRAGRYNEAVESFEQAVAADTTFALGHYRLALAHMWGSNDSDRIAAERAIAHGSRLAGPDKALLRALLPFFRGDADEAERQYRAILVKRPDESEVWYPLGEVLFHHNPMRGRRAAEAKAAFERALLLGPRDGPLTHLLEIAGLERDWVAFDSLFTGMQPASHFYYVGELVQAFRSGQPAERARVLNALRDSSDARLATAARHVMYLMEEPEHSLSVLALMTEPARPDNVRSWGYVHRAHLAISAGNVPAALAELRRAAPFDANRALQHEAWLLSLPHIAAPRSDLLRVRARLEAMSPAPPVERIDDDLVLRGDREIEPHVRLYLIGLLSAQLGDHSAALRAAADLMAQAGTPIARDLAKDLAHGVRAEVLRVQGRHAEALAELKRARMHFDANRLNIAPFYAQSRERLVRAELLTAVGRTEEALGWLGSFDEHGPWSRVVLAPAALRQARIYDSMGRYEEAARHYARFVGLWSQAEPRFAREVEQAKRRLAALQRAN